MVLHFREKDRISLSKKSSAPCLCHQIYAFGRSAREDDLVSRGGPQVVRDPFPRFFVRFRSARAQLMKPAMHVRVVVLVILPKSIEYPSRFLGGGRAIKVDQRMPVRLLAQDREILSERLPIYSASNLVHALICS